MPHRKLKRPSVIRDIQRRLEKASKKGMNDKAVLTDQIENNQECSRIEHARARFERLFPNLDDCQYKKMLTDEICEYNKSPYTKDNEIVAVNKKVPTIDGKKGIVYSVLEMGEGESIRHKEEMAKFMQKRWKEVEHRCKDKGNDRGLKRRLDSQKRQLNRWVNS